jgi:anti-sigma regulatory factor (Ser/Thr protein kinase)
MESAVELNLPRVPVSVARARAGIRPLREALGNRYEDAVLLVSELVTNAVRHGEGAMVRLEAGVRHGTCRFEIIDGGNGFEPPEFISDPGMIGGRGLPIVDAISDAWGVFEGDSTHVWFEIDLR